MINMNTDADIHSKNNNCNCNMSSYEPFEATDLLHLNNVNLDTLTENFPLDFYAEYLILWPTLFFKSIEHSSNIISGYMMGKTEGKGQDWHTHITAVTVASDFRRISLASKLCNTLEEITNTSPHNVNFIDLFVKCNNQLAINLYEKLGYSVYRRVVGYYNGPKEPYPNDLKSLNIDKDAFDMRKGMARDKGQSTRKDGRNHKCYPHQVVF